MKLFISITFTLVSGLFLVQYFLTTQKHYQATPFWSFTLNEAQNQTWPNWQGQEVELFNLIAHPDFYTKSKLLFRPNTPPLSLDSTDRIVVPLLGDGYWTYAKIAKQLAHFSRKQELLWAKDLHYYPAVDHYGKILLLLAADGTQILVNNRDGLAKGIERIHGTFLVDYDFATSTSAGALAFINGEIYVIDARGELLFYYAFPEKQAVLVKSCTLSMDASFVAVHFSPTKMHTHKSTAEASDYIWVFRIPKAGNSKNKKLAEVRALSRQIVQEPSHSMRKKAKKETKRRQLAKIRKLSRAYVLKLGQSYPHLIHMALNSHGLVLVAPDKSLFYRFSSRLQRKKQWSQPSLCDKDCPIYRPVYAAKDFLAYGDGDSWSLIGKNGDVLLQRQVQSEAPSKAQDDNKASNAKKRPWRFVPTPYPDIFGIDLGFRIDYYRYEETPTP